MSHYEDATPTWAALTHIYIGHLQEPKMSYEVHKQARESLMHVASLADKYIEKMRESITD